jgi:hypothetical protein
MFGDPSSEVFFGYYDITPFSADERRLLAIRIPTGGGSEPGGAEISVGYYSLGESSPAFVEIGRTATWCWQQGCRLQWFPGEADRSVLYNRFVDGGYGAVLQDIGSGQIMREYRRPIYSLSSDGQLGLSLNFARLQRLRPGYGYDNLPDETRDEPLPARDGIWSVDMETGESRLLISVAEAAGMKPQATMRGAEHYINHILWNPDSSRFMFFHLWMRGGNRYIRMITVGRNGEDPFVLYNEEHISHYWWLSRDELIAYSTHADSGSHYHRYRDREGCIGVIGKNVLTGDGHPSTRSESPWMLTDTYPDDMLERTLLLYNTESENLRRLGVFFSPPGLTGEFRCDLHPRWSPSGKMICIDSAHGGQRCMYVVDLNKD